MQYEKYIYNENTESRQSLVEKKLNRPIYNYTLCSKKTCDHIFDDKLKQNYPFTKIFGILITKSIGQKSL